MADSVIVTMPSTELALGVLVAAVPGARADVRLERMQAAEGRFELIVVERVEGVTPQAWAGFERDYESRYGQRPQMLRQEPQAGRWWIRVAVPTDALRSPMLKFAVRFFEHGAAYGHIEGATFTLRVDLPTEAKGHEVRDRFQAFLTAGHGQGTVLPAGATMAIHPELLAPPS